MSDLKSQLDGYAANIPAALADRIAAGVAEVNAAGVAPGLAVGSIAPSFSLPDSTGEIVSLDTLLEHGPVVVTFYRGDWCPFCNLQLNELQKSLGEIEAAGGRLVAISGQAPDHASGLTEKHALTFPVLSDLDQSVSAAYKVRFDLFGELEDLQVNVFQNDPATQNANGQRTLPAASTFIVGQDHVVTFSSVDADWRNRVEPSVVVDALKALQK